MSDREAAADNIALITFAAYPRLLCPFTLDVDAITGFLESLKPVENRAEDGTGIGVGLAKAVAVLRESVAKSRVVVLLTDGENNQDEITPLQAGEMAAEEGVRVYTIFAGLYSTDRFGRMVEADGRIDTSELETIASTTGGKFFRARDKAALEACYEQIEALERTEREDSRFAEFYELYERWLVGALVLYLASWLSACTWARRLP
jgi:Ca-activated chloride channel family protein